MAPRSWTRTIDIECKDFPTGTLSSDVVQWVFDYFKTEHPEFKVVSVQQCSGRVARVTVDKGCEAARPAHEELGEVTIHGVQCFVLRPEPPSLVWLMFWFTNTLMNFRTSLLPMLWINLVQLKRSSFSTGQIYPKFPPVPGLSVWWLRRKFLVFL